MRGSAQIGRQARLTVYGLSTRSALRSPGGPRGAAGAGGRQGATRTTTLLTRRGKPDAAAQAAGTTGPRNRGPRHRSAGGAGPNGRSTSGARSHEPEAPGAATPGPHSARGRGPNPTRRPHDDRAERTRGGTASAGQRRGGRRRATDATRPDRGAGAETHTLPPGRFKKRRPHKGRRHHSGGDEREATPTGRGSRGLSPGIPCRTGGGRQHKGPLARRAAPGTGPGFWQGPGPPSGPGSRRIGGAYVPPTGSGSMHWDSPGNLTRASAPALGPTGCRSP